MTMDADVAIYLEKATVARARQFLATVRTTGGPSS